MDEYLLTFRSITYAQRAARTLRYQGISNWTTRTPQALAQNGCGYALRIKTRDIREAQESLLRENIWPTGTFRAGPEGYYEVKHDLS